MLFRFGGGSIAANNRPRRAAALVGFGPVALGVVLQMRSVLGGDGRVSFSQRRGGADDDIVPTSGDAAAGLLQARGGGVPSGRGHRSLQEEDACALCKVFTMSVDADVAGFEVRSFSFETSHEGCHHVTVYHTEGDYDGPTSGFVPFLDDGSMWTKICDSKIQSSSAVRNEVPPQDCTMVTALPSSTHTFHVQGECCDPTDETTTGPSYPQLVGYEYSGSDCTLGSFTGEPTVGPTAGPTSGPMAMPTVELGGLGDSPTSAPTSSPTSGPTSRPTSGPTAGPTSGPTASPTSAPASAPTTSGPTSGPTSRPTSGPTAGPTTSPTTSPTVPKHAGSEACPDYGPMGGALVPPTRRGRNMLANAERDLAANSVVDLGPLTNYLFFFDNADSKANWQGATKGFYGDVAVDGITAAESTSGTVPYAGTIYTNTGTLEAWQDIVDDNAAADPPNAAASQVGQTEVIDELTAAFTDAFESIHALTATVTLADSNDLSNLPDYKDGIDQTIVIDITDVSEVKTQWSISGDAGDVFVMRWGYPLYDQQVKASSGGGIVPAGDTTAGNFVHLAGDLNASGGGENPPAPYPQGPRDDDGTGTLVNNGGDDWGGGGFFTGYWLTIGDPDKNNESSDLSNGIFVGGWYSNSTKWSMTSGTSGVHVCPNSGLFV